MPSTTFIKRAFAAVVLGACIIALLAQLATAIDLFAFEWPVLAELMGFKGALLIVFVNFCLGLAAVVCLRVLRHRASRHRAATVISAVPTVLGMLWVLQWLFLQMPFTARLASAFTAGEIQLPAAAQRDFDSFSLARGVADPKAREQLLTMYARVYINNPDIFARHPIGATIDRYATRYDIDPAYIFFRNYLNSWYGEAPAGPLPFFRQMTAETLRDIVQTHLPAWFVESDLRRRIISMPLQSWLGENLGFKVRYALHKSTLDVSSQPYDLNTFSDILLVLIRYPEEFDDLLKVEGDSLRTALRDSFKSLRSSALVPPFDDAYHTPPYDDAYYDGLRVELKRFARAAYYLCVLDFDFATRAQALLTRFQREYYVAALGRERWQQIQPWQQTLMYAMVRDLYRGNVGRLGYNLYAIPELNVAPLKFVATAARDEPGLGGEQAKLWRPQNYDLLWAGAGYQLHVFHEVLWVTRAQTIPGIGRTDTIEAARTIVLLNQ